MITYTTGNIFESNAKCLVNTVNCEGYMGKGIAYQFKLRYPQNNRDYVRACKSGELRIGTIHSFSEDGRIIVNLPTKNKWREKSQISYVEVGLDLLTDFIDSEAIPSIALPPLGCGNGGLIWGDVKQIIETKFRPLAEKCDITVYEPSRTYKVIAKEPPKLTVSSLVLLQIKMHLCEWGYLRMQKACYFTNYYLGEEYFKFDRNQFGPYSHAVDIVARGIKEYQKYYQIKDTGATYNHAYQIVASEKTDKALQRIIPAIEKSASLVNGLKSNKELEGVATVLFLVKENADLDENRIINLFKEWSKDKANRFSEQEIIKCINFLEDNSVVIKNLLGVYEVY